MGCDIHATIDVGGWTRAILSIDRDYLLFSVLAGVRVDPHEKTSYVEPRGELSDVDFRTKKHVYDDWNDDGHSFSWLYVEELEAAALEYNRIASTRDWPEAWSRKSTQLEAIIAFMRAWDTPTCRARLIFCFDN